MSARTDGDVRPTVYTVPPHEPFVDALAGGILSGRTVPLDPGDPLALSRLTILLPTRRSCRALGLAFLRAAPGQALLLPRIRPLGDIDEDEMSIGDEADETLPDAVSPLERRLLLSQLIQRLGETPGGAALTGAGTVDQAARLAQALASLLDEIQIARIDPQGLATLAPEEYAAPLAAGAALPLAHHRPLACDPGGARPDGSGRTPQRPAGAPRRTVAGGAAGLSGDRRGLDRERPCHPRPAGRHRAPAPGRRRLPGLDTQADDETWEAIGPTHPQYALKGLLAHIGVAREAVQPWPADERAGASATRSRSRLIGDAMRPAETITAWRARPPQEPETLRDFHRIDCASPQEEAGVIAIVMRRALDTPGRTAALVTLDRALARRVAAELRRWEIAVDDSAGVPLGETVPGAYLRLTARLVAEDAAPVPLLAALKQSAGRWRHGASGMAPLRQGHGAGDPAGSATRAGVWRLASGTEGGRPCHRPLARPAGEGRRALHRPHGRAGRRARRARAGSCRLLGMACGHG